LLINALTVDVEDYYHVTAFEDRIDRAAWDCFPSRVEANTGTLLDALAAASVRATFFVLGWVAERQPRLVRAIAAAGHEVGCHSYWHRLIYQQSPAAFRADTRRGRDVLQDVLGRKVHVYRAPSFSITSRSLWALDVLIEEGFTVDSSVYPTFHDRYGIPDAPLAPHRVDCPSGVLWEVPLAVCRVAGYPLPVGGGGYFRLYPYFVTRHLLRSINRGRRPFVAYLHPWELDAEQPRVRASWLRHLRHRVGLRHTRARLNRLLRDFSWGTISDLINSSHGDVAPVADVGVAA
jgi:polysaccharide deacetylase family protein (PEP-CTERM system associated)